MAVAVRPFFAASEELAQWYSRGGLREQRPCGEARPSCHVTPRLKGPIRDDGECYAARGEMTSRFFLLSEEAPAIAELVASHNSPRLVDVDALSGFAVRRLPSILVRAMRRLGVEVMIEARELVHVAVMHVKRRKEKAFGVAGSEMQTPSGARAGCVPTRA